MHSTIERRTGGRVLVDQLRIHGPNTVFCVPGESYLDALHDANPIRLVTCRQEGGAAMMAEAHGKLTEAVDINPGPRIPMRLHGS